MLDIKKRIDRKRQIIEMAQTGYVNAKQELDETEHWIKSKSEEMENLKTKPVSPESLTDCKNITKEIENKLMLIESLENKIETISTDIEQSEFEELKQKLTLLFEEQRKLAELSKVTLKSLAENSDYQKKFEADFGEVQNWRCVEAKQSCVFTNRPV